MHAALNDQILDRLNDFVCLCGEGIINEINIAGTRFLGGRKDDFRGRAFAEIVHPDYQDALADGLTILTESGALLKIQRHDGSFVDVEVQAAELDSGLLMVSVRDVSERTRIASQMVESEHQFRHLVDLTTDMISVWQDGRMDFVNASGVRMLGAERAEQLHPIRFRDLVHESLRETYGASLNGLAASPHPVPMKFYRADGAEIDVEVSVKPFGRDSCFMVDARDVTAERRAVEALRHSEQHLRSVLDSVADGIVVIDQNNAIRSVNRAAERLFGLSAQEARGKTVSLLMQDTRSNAMQVWTETGRHPDGTRAYVVAHETIGHHQSTGPVPVELTVTEFQEGDETFRIGVIRDISERKKAEERIRHQASHDTLTDLPNRSNFYGRLEQFLAVNKRRNRQGALLLLNLDGFKLVNDTLGLPMGDRLLQAVALRLAEQKRTEEFIARLGADDFVVIQPEIGASYEAAITARRLIDAMEAPFDLDGFEINVTASVGIALFPDDADDANSLVKHASAALLRAKEHGRASFSLFTADLNEVINERLTIRSGLVKALEQNEFSLVYQPKVDLSNRRMAGVEALLRWKSAEHGPVSPVRFIPVLEETSMINTVGQWVLETACQQQRAWADQGFPDIRVAVNLSVRQLRSGLVPMVESVLARMGVAPHLLEIEITESLLMRDTDNAVSMLCALAEMGIELAIDDFGTGYSSLSYLKRLPLNNIKIDRSFITDLAIDNDAIEIVRTIIAMGHSLRRRIIAEGVETVEQLEILDNLGADEVQGYFFSQPVAPDAIVRMLGNGEAFGRPRVMAAS